MPRCERHRGVSTWIWRRAKPGSPWGAPQSRCKWKEGRPGTSTKICNDPVLSPSLVLVDEYRQIASAERRTVATVTRHSKSPVALSFNIIRGIVIQHLQRHRLSTSSEASLEQLRHQTPEQLFCNEAVRFMGCPPFQNPQTRRQALPPRDRVGARALAVLHAASCR